MSDFSSNFLAKAQYYFNLCVIYIIESHQLYRQGNKLGNAATPHQISHCKTICWPTCPKFFHNTDKFLELRGYFFGFKIAICTLLKDFKQSSNRMGNPPATMTFT